MKPFANARQVLADVSDARDDLTRAADSAERAARLGMAVFLLVGLVASLALVIAVSKE